MKSFINKYKYQFLLTFIVFILFFVNYKPGTYLSGWDNLQTELNPGLAVKRAFFSVWEEYQSFGLTAGMAHAADLPRTVFLWIVSSVLPQNMIRYFYHFLMLLIGGLGAFELIKNMDSRLRGNDPTSPSGLRGASNETAAFLGSLFYILNLGTVQIFHLPYEAFSTFFALLPWAIWIFLKILSNETLLRSTSYDGQAMKQSNNWLFFFFINLLGTPAFYTQQLFIVYILVLGCVALAKVLNSRFRGNDIKRIFFAFLLIFIINSFWLLPQFYFLKTNGRVVSEAKNNQLSTENVFYQNYEKGTLGNFLRLEGFYFDLKGINNASLFAPWKDHFESPIIGALPYLFTGLMLIGFAKNLIAAVKHKQNKEQAASIFSAGLVLIYLLCATGLLLATPPFSWINELIRQLPIVNQIFRSPFTKFIIPYSLIYSFFIVIGLDLILKMLKGKTLNLFIYLFVYFFIFLYSLPSFQGYFISPEMKAKIPSDYFQMMDYFKTTDKSKRIALLPDYTFWGWFFNKWGYNGSGFLWYGIEQPIASRTFDVWSKTSESYFWEAKTAFEAEDINKLISVFDKYQINYLLLDKSLIPVVSSYKALQYDRINNLLMQNSRIFQIFSGENISLYKINHGDISKSFISLSTNFNNIGPKIDITSDDQAFLENNSYLSDNLEPDIDYPFLNLTSQTNLKEKSWQISQDDNYFYLSTPLTINADDFDLYHNDIYQETILVDGLLNNISLKLVSTIEDNKLTVKIEKKIIKNFNTNIDQKTDFGFTDSTLSQNIGYLIKTQSIDNQGPPLFFYIVDETKKQSYLEDQLDKQTNYFIIPPRYKYGLGYTFAFQNKSFKNFRTSNNLEKLSLYLFPYQNLKEMKFIRKGFNRTEAHFSNDYEVKKLNYFTYKVISNNEVMKQFSNLILYQSFDPGWVAFADGKILNHILVNNWANSWRLHPEQIGTTATQETDVTIIFWPQYLEFLGFGLMIVTCFIILRR